MTSDDVMFEQLKVQTLIQTLENQRNAAMNQVATMIAEKTVAETKLKFQDQQTQELVNEIARLKADLEKADSKYEDLVEINRLLTSGEVSFNAGRSTHPSDGEPPPKKPDIPKEQKEKLQEKASEATEGFLKNLLVEEAQSVTRPVKDDIFADPEAPELPNDISKPGVSDGSILGGKYQV